MPDSFCCLKPLPIVVDCTGSLAIKILDGSYQVCVEVVLSHGSPQRWMPHPVKWLLEIDKDMVEVLLMFISDCDHSAGHSPIFQIWLQIVSSPPAYTSSDGIFKYYYYYSPLLHALHWLPMSQRIDYKLATLCFKVINKTAPHAITEILTV